MNGITIKENQSLFFQAEDKDGKILATNSISIYKIGKISPDMFTISTNFYKRDLTVGYVDVIPMIPVSHELYQDIYYKLSKKPNWPNLTSPTKHNSTEYSKIENKETLTFASDTEIDFTIYFEIRNTATGGVMLSKSIDIHLEHSASSKDESGGGVIGGATNGEDDYSGIISNNPFLTLDENSSIKDAIKAAKESFETFAVAFTILPGFVWALISILLIVCIALRILQR